jgi:predicted PurR-regulated permease PerM
MGVLVAKFAGGAAEVIGWIAFILLVAYFILFESKGISGQMINVELPGYALDIRRMGVELGKIWNAFLRGQLLIIAITIVIYTVLLSILGLRFALGLALLAGLARFVPYVGPAIAWTTLGLVAFFQPENYFHFTPLVYALVCVGVAWVMDVALDNLVATRILANALKVHPAAVLVMALVGANLIGLIGVVLASPVTASIKLFGRYLVRKLFDLDPWEGLERMDSSASDPRWIKGLRRFWKRIVKIITKGSPQTK